MFPKKIDNLEIDWLIHLKTVRYIRFELNTLKFNINPEIKIERRVIFEEKLFFSWKISLKFEWKIGEQASAFSVCRNASPGPWLNVQSLAVNSCPAVYR